MNGQRRILLSGSIHYPRSVPEVLLPAPPTASRSFPENAGPNLTLILLLSVGARLQMWPDLIQKAKDGGLDVVQT